MSQDNSQGVYFLANDAIREWAIAFLESFREFNPDLRLILIPFDQRCNAIMSLQPRYRFEVFDDPSFAALEEIGYRINRGQVPHAPHWFRRFAAFWGPLEEFLYLDGRIVVLSDLRELIAARRASGCDLLHYDCALDQVYWCGEFRTKLLRERRVRGFLSGMFASHRGLFTLDELQSLAEQADAVREHLNTRNADQCFLNFICDTKPITYASFAEVIPDLAANAWAWFGGLYLAGTEYRRWDHGGLDHNRRVPFLHWAGLPNNAIMPYRRLFLRYRLRPEPVQTRLARRLSWAVQYPILKAIDALRRARWTNVMYHRLRHHLLGVALPQPLQTSREAVSQAPRT